MALGTRSLTTGTTSLQNCCSGFAVGWEWISTSRLHFNKLDIGCCNIERVHCHVEVIGAESNPHVECARPCVKACAPFVVWRKQPERVVQCATDGITGWVVYDTGIHRLNYPLGTCWA